MAPKIVIVSLGLILLIGCKNGPTVNLTTAEPLKVDPMKVDLNMRVDVYQHADTSSAETRGYNAAGCDR